ncbi:hypothetical protein IEQ11_10115 [Lysobacter capsici]|jgi:hypothetical protein|uniref:hypothetical protein n=1 Tax=Lysobacter capsici TaxID=435897 RepID=UPI00044B572D|nr:hypothetical protein [Lysobacter capsici]UOF16953.1 hypothetical protein IEQ11_10115 [Lysobacter capsici]
MAAVKRKKQAAASETTLRHFWLAGLGLAVIARREAIASAGRAAGSVQSLQQRVRDLAVDARSNVRGGIETVRDQVEPKVVKFSADVEARLAPVLDKLGLKKDGKGRGQRKSRKPAAKAKPQSRRVVRKPAARRARKA